jgi:hypothetical protein
MIGLAHAEIANNSRRNSAACENLSLLAPYLDYHKDIIAPLIRWCLERLTGWPAP